MHNGFLHVPDYLGIIKRGHEATVVCLGYLANAGYAVRPAHKLIVVHAGVPVHTIRGRPANPRQQTQDMQPFLRVLCALDYQQLTHLKETALKEDEIVNDFYNQVIGNTGLEDPYLILLMHDGYDIPHHSKDGRRDAENSTGVFSYILCAVCPVKMTKPTLSYNADRNLFTSKDADWVVSAPEMGFMFPAFEERAANIYRSLFYTKDTSVTHDDFVAAVFMSELPMAADEQKELFHTIMQSSLDEECSYKVMQTLHETIMEKAEAQKEAKAAEPLCITKYDVIEAMEECGVSAEHMDAFTESFDREFGGQTKLNAVNITSTKQFEIKTPNAVLRVDADRSDLVETREIDGHTYILLRADDGMEVIGVNIADARK